MAENVPPAKRPRYTWEEDVEVECDDEIIKVHSHVMMAASEVFVRMLQTDMKEARTGRIVLPGKSSEGFKEVLKHLDLRGGAEPPPVTAKNLDLLLRFSDEYQVVGLKFRCMSWMRTKVDSRPVDMLRLANAYDVPDVACLAARSLLENIATIRAVERLPPPKSLGKGKNGKGKARPPPTPAELQKVRAETEELLALQSGMNPAIRLSVYEELLQMVCGKGKPTQLNWKKASFAKHWRLLVNFVLDMKVLFKSSNGDVDARNVAWTRTFRPLLSSLLENFELKQKERLEAGGEEVQGPDDEKEEEEEKDEDEEESSSSDDED
mmetsp:Transcript_65284/g.153701  ORF Transcript_65284/g.153701 Transcript_65284/m.153701 type:complete len:322 (+) Transcript_65284:42-1007(+)